MKRQMVHVVATYQIEVEGTVNEKELNAASPIEITVINADAAATRFTISSDQSGLVGLIRHLHARGFLLLSAVRRT